MAFLDDVIHNEIPPDLGSQIIVPSAIHHPCSVRGLDLNSDCDGLQLTQARQKDLHQLVEACQIHKHNFTCFKYWKGPPHPRECRFDLDENHFVANSYINNNSGEICLRCLDGMVNNFNASMLEAVRCNMDIKFIRSGVSAKAILYYITDYITKSQLKAHVAYAALDLTRRKLSEFDSGDDDLTVHAKELIRKSAHAMISHQELSSQQVAAYLLDTELDANEEQKDSARRFLTAEAIMKLRSHSRPSFDLCDGHMQSQTHCLVVCHPDRCCVPVPIGPSLPRSDRPDFRERYCRLMLVLFKPWIVVEDLLSTFTMWSEAFKHFLKACSEDKKFIMKNMQVLHECKDSRDDHFANCRQC